MCRINFFFFLGLSVVGNMMYFLFFRVICLKIVLVNLNIDVWIVFILLCILYFLLMLVYIKYKLRFI